MGTLFEPPFGSFPGMDSYGSKNFVSFGPPVDFEAGFVQEEQWQNEKEHHNETFLSNEAPGMLIHC
jgi:hypothetical protein